MPLESLDAKELARCLAQDLNALARIDRKNRDESNELIDRIHRFIRQLRPDLFVPAPPKEPQP